MERFGIESGFPFSTQHFCKLYSAAKSPRLVRNTANVLNASYPATNAQRNICLISILRLFLKMLQQLLFLVSYIRFQAFLMNYFRGKSNVLIFPNSWSPLFLHPLLQIQLLHLKGKFPQTTMWIGWEESNFWNPTVKVWADLDNPFKRSDYAKLCMSPSQDGTLPEYVISQEDNFPLTLYIDFHNC